ncbi:MAG: DNA replication/repair protein RecF, partial [Rhizobiales bacterium]|nr:DNA replication/repair protein RecF [Hyphomicrobiales bacterium]
MAAGSCRLHDVSEQAGIGGQSETTAPGMVALRRLTLTDFRNYEHLMLHVDPVPVVLTGENGAGKTNLLEAISFFSPGRGLRRAALADCARHGGAGGWAAACEIERAAGPTRLGTGLAGDGEGMERQRKCRIDGQPVGSSGAFSEYLQIVWLTPSMDRLFTGPASDRRRFVDRLVGIVDHGHQRSTSRYERAMSERNRLLALGSGETSWIEALEAQMAEIGVALAASRLMALGRLQGLIDDAGRDSAFPPAQLGITGTLEAALADLPAVDVEDRFRGELKAARGRDQAAGRALSGPHRSDLATHHAMTGADAAHCSSGEQKALLISVILAKARLASEQHGGEAPV